MSKDKEKDNSEKTKKEETKESDLEELLEKFKEKSSEKDEENNKDSEDKKESKEIIIETKKDNPKNAEEKTQRIQSRISESEMNRFFENLNQNSPVSLIPRNSFSFQPQRNLESGLSETSSPNLNLNTNQQNPNKESSFEYMPKQDNDSSQKVYQSYESTPKIKMQKPEEIAKTWSQPFQQREAEFISSESGKIGKQENMYETYIKPQRMEDLQKDKKERNLPQPTESKMEYYSHK